MIPNPSILFNGMPSIVRCEPNWYWKPQPLTDFDFWYILDGKGTLRLNGGKYNLSAGSCFVLKPGDHIYATQETSRRLLVFYLHFNFIESQKKQPMQVLPGGMMAHTQITRNFDILSLFARKCESSFCRGDGLGLKQSNLYFRQMLLTYVEEAQVKNLDPTDLKIMEWIDKMRRDARMSISVEEIAKYCKLSRSQFTRRFQLLTKTSPNRYLILSRIERACRLLEESDLNINQIADALGYEDIFFFSKQFKRFKGEPPATMRKRLRSMNRNKDTHKTHKI